MVLYIIYAVIFTIMLYFFEKDTSIVIPIVLLLLLDTFRAYTVGTDYMMYYNFYSWGAYASLLDNFDLSKIIANFGQDKSSELGWGILNSLSYNIGLPFYVVNLFIITIILLFYKSALYRQSPDMYLSIYLFLMLGFYYSTFNIMRQVVSIAIFVYSIRYIKEKKPGPYLFCCFFAFLFHTSALLLPFLYLIKYIKINRPTLIVLLLTSIIIPLSGLDRVIISFFFNEMALTVYEHYADLYGNTGLNAMGKFINMFLLVIQVLMFIYCYLNQKEHNIYMMLWMFGLIIQNITMNYSWLFRLGGYFLIAQIIALPLFIYQLESESVKRKLSYSFIIVYCIILYGIRVFINADGIVPYSMQF